MLLLLLLGLNSTDLRLHRLVHHLAGDVLLDDDLTGSGRLQIIWCLDGVDVLLLLGRLLIERFADRVLIGGRSGSVVVELHRTGCRLEVAGEIQTGWRCVAVLVMLLLLLLLLLLVLDLLLMLLGEILQQVLLQMVVRDGRIQLLPQSEGLLLVGKRFGGRFNLCLDLLPLQLLELHLQLAECRWLLLLLLLLGAAVRMLSRPGSSLIEPFPLPTAARGRTGLIDLVKVVVATDGVMMRRRLLLTLADMAGAGVFAEIQTVAVRFRTAVRTEMLLLLLLWRWLLRSYLLRVIDLGKV